MNLSSKIAMLNNRYSKPNNLGGLCIQYYQKKIVESDLDLILDYYTGFIEKSSALGYLSIEPVGVDFEKIYSQINHPLLKKNLSIFHIIGVCLLFKSVDDYRYHALLKDWFDNHSIRVKFLISIFFSEYNEQFLLELKSEDGENFGLILLKNCFLKGFTKIIENYEHNGSEDIIHLIILIEFNKKLFNQYEEDKEKLKSEIFFASRDIQSKHRVFNNNEDQFNSVLHSMLSMNYFVENQSQRGVSSEGRTFGELDLKVFTKKNKYPLTIIEAFKISIIDKAYISKHLNKLTENYDPNGLSRNFVIIYVNNKNFNDIWERYLDFLNGFEYAIDIVDKQIVDDTLNYPTFSNIKIGLTTFQYNKLPIEVCHIFLNMFNKTS